MRPDIVIKYNEAWIESPRFSVYYGPKNIDENTQEWLCIIKKNDKEVARYTNSQLLDIACGDGPSDMLIAGLSLYLGK